MRIKWVSYYTPRYKEEAVRLMQSLDKHGLDGFVEEVPEFSDEPGKKFLQAVRAKPAFILECFKRFSNYDAIVWTDADSEVLRPPKLLYELDGCDMACRFREGFELLSGTMLWRVCYKVHQFLPEWIRMVNMEEAQKLSCPEQQILQEVLPRTGLEVYRLPEEYVYIAPHPEMPEDALRERANVAREVVPVIYHHQKSRETRGT
jgi:hypothetical protein